MVQRAPPRACRVASAGVRTPCASSLPPRAHSLTCTGELRSLLTRRCGAGAGSPAGAPLVEEPPSGLRITCAPSPGAGGALAGQLSRRGGQAPQYGGGRTPPSASTSGAPARELPALSPWRGRFSPARSAHRRSAGWAARGATKTPWRAGLGARACLPAAGVCRCACAGEPPDPPLDSSAPDCVCAAGAGV